MLKISDNVKQDENQEPNVLIVSNHHARELIVPELALHIATQLLASTKNVGDSTVDEQKVVQENQIYILHTLNPDGLNTVWTKDRMARTNNNGVDLNRNYPIGFKDACGGDADRGSETYRGPQPFSEPETQTMRAFQQDKKFAKLLDFHSYARQVRINCD